MILKVIVNGDYILPRDIIPDIIYNKIRSCIHSKYEIHIVVSTFTGYIDSIGISVNNRVYTGYHRTPYILLIIKSISINGMINIHLILKLQHFLDI